MTQGIIKALNLPTVEELLESQGIDIEKIKEDKQKIENSELSNQEVQKLTESIDLLNEMMKKSELVEGKDHANAMDEVYKEILTHARDLVEMGYNIDQPRARGIFEIAALFYGHAMNAKISKRDSQLKTMKLALDKRKLDLDEAKFRHLIGQGVIENGEPTQTGMVEDRNEIIKRLRNKN